jgi:hypothetical protein
MMKGRQHYEPNEYWGVEFSDIIMRDNRKRFHMQSNHIDLLEIPYWNQENSQEFHGILSQLFGGVTNKLFLVFCFISFVYRKSHHAILWKFSTN